MKLTNLQINALTNKIYDLANEDLKDKLDSFDDRTIVAKLEKDLKYKEQLKIIDEIDKLGKREKVLWRKLRTEYDEVALVNSYSTSSEVSRLARSKFQSRVDKAIRSELSVPTKKDIEKEIVFLTIGGGAENIVDSLKEHFKIGK